MSKPKVQIILAFSQFEFHLTFRFWNLSFTMGDLDSQKRGL